MLDTTASVARAATWKAGRMGTWAALPAGRKAVAHISSQLYWQPMNLLSTRSGLVKPLQGNRQPGNHYRRHFVTPFRPPGEKLPVPNAVVGIDLGTSNSAVGIIDSGEAKIVHTNDGATTCSWVAFTEVSTRPTFTFLKILPSEFEN